MKLLIVNKLDKGYQIDSGDSETKEVISVAKSTRKDAVSYIFTELANVKEFHVYVPSEDKEGK